MAMPNLKQPPMAQTPSVPGSKRPMPKITDDATADYESNYGGNYEGAIGGLQQQLDAARQQSLTAESQLKDVMGNNADLMNAARRRAAQMAAAGQSRYSLGSGAGMQGLVNAAGEANVALSDQQQRLMQNQIAAQNAVNEAKFKEGGVQTQMSSELQRLATERLAKEQKEQAAIGKITDIIDDEVGVMKTAGDYWRAAQRVKSDVLPLITDPQRRQYVQAKIQELEYKSRHAWNA